jgi:hypothetical protein
MGRRRAKKVFREACWRIVLAGRDLPEQERRFCVRAASVAAIRLRVSVRVVRAPGVPVLERNAYAGSGTTGSGVEASLSAEDR